MYNTMSLQKEIFPYTVRNHSHALNTSILRVSSHHSIEQHMEPKESIVHLPMTMALLFPGRLIHF